MSRSVAPDGSVRAAPQTPFHASCLSSAAQPLRKAASEAPRSRPHSGSSPHDAAWSLARVSGTLAGGAGGEGGQTGFSIAGHAAACAAGGCTRGDAHATTNAATATARTIPIGDNERAAERRGEGCIGLGPARGTGGARDRGGDRVVDVSEEAEGGRGEARAPRRPLSRLNAGRAERSA